jgi:hypothetical protein
VRKQRLGTGNTGQLRIWIFDCQVDRARASVGTWVVHATDAENSSLERTSWSTNSVFAPDVQVYVSKRSEYSRIGTWLGGGVPPALKLFHESAKEIVVNTPAGGDDYVVVAADESIGYQVFGPETQKAYVNWLATWNRVKHWGGSFTIQLGGRNLEIEIDEFHRRAPESSRTWRSPGPQLSKRAALELR